MAEVFIRYTLQPYVHCAHNCINVLAMEHLKAPVIPVECMCFGNVSICLCEYLPLGPNMIQSVSETLGSRDRSYPGARSKNGFILKQRQKDKARETETDRSQRDRSRQREDLGLIGAQNNIIYDPVAWTLF